MLRSRCTLITPTTKGRWPSVVSAVLLNFALAGVSSGATLYVRAGAAADGTGSEQRPFSSLPAVEAASVAGDAIVVLPSPADAKPLDGGIALKPRQHLRGRAAPGMAARITNSSAVRVAGDAVRLADATEVSGLEIVRPYRGGIYGLNISGANVHDNRIIGNNVSCSDGYAIFLSDEHARIDKVWLKNPRAGILIDADTGSISVTVRGNEVSDSPCSDGIDIRASGSAYVLASIDGNSISNLRQGRTHHSIIAMGVQTRDNATAIVHSNDNRISNIGNLFDAEELAERKAKRIAGVWGYRGGGEGGANCEGVFTNQTGGTLIWTIERLKFSHGIGGNSCNGAEFWIAEGDSVQSIIVRDSEFEDNAGDMIEQNNTAVGGKSIFSVVLDGVKVRRTTKAGKTPNPIDAVPPLTAFTGGGYCVNFFNTAMTSVSTLKVVNSELLDCASDGIFAFNGKFLLDPADDKPSNGPVGKIAIELTNTRISGVGGYGVHWVNYLDLADLTLRMEGNQIQGTAGRPAVLLAQSDGASTANAVIDLGGGALGSKGGNCLLSSAGGPIEVRGYDSSLTRTPTACPAQ